MLKVTLLYISDIEEYKEKCSDYVTKKQFYALFFKVSCI